MIKISSEILSEEELKEASGKAAKDIDIEITNIRLLYKNGGKSGEFKR